MKRNTQIRCFLADALQGCVVAGQSTGAPMYIGTPMKKYTVVKVDGATPKRWRFVRDHDKPIHGSCAIYFPGRIRVKNFRPNYGNNNGFHKPLKKKGRLDLFMGVPGYHGGVSVDDRHDMGFLNLHFIFLFLFNHGNLSYPPQSYPPNK